MLGTTWSIWTLLRVIQSAITKRLKMTLKKLHTSTSARLCPKTPMKFATVLLFSLQLQQMREKLALPTLLNLRAPFPNKLTSMLLLTAPQVMFWALCIVMKRKEMITSAFWSVWFVTRIKRLQCSLSLEPTKPRYALKWLPWPQRQCALSTRSVHSCSCSKLTGGSLALFA